MLWYSSSPSTSLHTPTRLRSFHRNGNVDDVLHAERRLVCGHASNHIVVFLIQTRDPESTHDHDCVVLGNRSNIVRIQRGEVLLQSLNLQRQKADTSLTSFADSTESIFEKSVGRNRPFFPDSRFGTDFAKINFSNRSHLWSFRWLIHKNDESIDAIGLWNDPSVHSCRGADERVGLAVLMLLSTSGLNILTKENIDFTLENNSTVLAVWNSPNCMDCQKEMWNVYKVIYSFLDEPKVCNWRLACDFVVLCNGSNDWHE